MSYRSPYASSAQDQEPRRFSMPRGIKNMLKSLKSSHPSSSRVSIEPAVSSGSGARARVGGSQSATYGSKQASGRPGGRIRRGEDASPVSTPPHGQQQAEAQSQSGSGRGGSTALYGRTSLRELLSGHSSKEMSPSGVPVSHPHVRQIDVKPSPDAAAKALVCDKCDGKHETDRCPYFKKDREKHPDAQKGNKRLGGTSKLPGATIRNARVARQPGDGSCLFHSLSFGLRDGSSAASLRRQICAFIVDNPKLKIADTPLSDWVKWDSRSSVSQYARRMSGGAWGGGIEMAAVSKMKGVNVHVYEQCGALFKRISAFDHEENPETKPVIRVLYGGGVHYDALVV